MKRKKKSPNLTPEQRAAKAERCRRMNRNKEHQRAAALARWSNERTP